MKNFLSIVWYKVLPPVYGGQRGIALFNQYLGQRVPLTCLCSSDNVPAGGLPYRVVNELPVSKAQFWNPFVRKKILDRIKADGSTHVIIEHPYHGWLGRHKDRLHFQFIVHAHNIEHLRMKARGKPWWRQIRSMEEEAFGYADLILFKTREDMELAQEMFDLPGGRCMIIPYGISLRQPPELSVEERDEFRRRWNIGPQEKILLFAGGLSYEPNRQALENIITHLIPALRQHAFGFRIIVCGNGSSRHAFDASSFPEIIMAGEVEDLEVYLRCADLFINPVLVGSGVQTKNLEALANSLPIACTAFAARGLPSYLKPHVIVSPDNDWKQMANNIIDAPSPGAPMPPAFYQEYHWEHIMDAFLRRLVLKG